jgi:hypothetical protein
MEVAADRAARARAEVFSVHVPLNTTKDAVE